jgi:hypothetical protein
MLLPLLQAPKRFKTTNPSTQKKKKTNKQKQTKTLPDIWSSRNALVLIFSPFLSF